MSNSNKKTGKELLKALKDKENEKAKTSKKTNKKK